VNLSKKLNIINMSVNINDLKEQIDTICLDKGLKSDEVINAIQKSIASAYRKELGDKDKAYICEFDVNTGKYVIYETITVVDEALSSAKEITVGEAQLYNPNAQVGDIKKEKVLDSDSIDFGRIASQVARQVLFQTINAAKHSKVLQEYKDKVGELINVEVDFMKKGGFLVKFGQTSAFMSKDQLMPNEKLRPGQTIRAVIQDIREDEQGNTRITLSRTHESFVLAIINQEIPEVEAGLVRIEKIVREAGFRTKILVSATDEEANIDPVGAILGRRNVRIINIMREITPSMQEKIDVVEFIPDNLPLMIMDSLEPAQIERVEINEENRMADVYCYADEAFLAVGKRGVNIRLAGKLLDYDINLMTLEGNNPHTSETIIAEQVN
jgi:transcription termination/antitermination protein NusA